jgi:predicted porin
MHKTVIALAIAGMAAAPAFADSNVTLYGSVDYAYGGRSGDSGLSKASLGPGNPKQEFISDVTGQNALGFKGSEDLGNGTKVIFELEAGFRTDDGTNSFNGGSNNPNGPVFRRHSWVGLTGDWGTFLGGRVDGARWGVSTRYEPFHGAGVANSSSLQVHASRADNAIAFVTPNVEGLYAVLAYTSQLIGQENGYNQGDVRDWIIQPNYTYGPFSATLNYEHLTAHNTEVKINVYVGAASYDFGVAKIMGYYEHVKTDGSAACDSLLPGQGSLSALCDQNSWVIGGTVPVTENDTVKASYVDYTDKSGAANSCRKWGIGGQHDLSKRTSLFVDFASITQRDHGACTIFYNGYQSSADDGTGNNTGGVGTRGYDLGIVHRF